MDQSHGKPLPEPMSREMTSSCPTPSRSLSAPEVGTQRPVGGGGWGVVMAWPPHVGPPFVKWIAEEEDRTFGCDLNSKFSFNISKENLVKKSKCKRNVKDWFKHYNSTLFW
jgi:hypothetical protein